MLISIIIPTYNVEHYVAEALDSAIAQTYRPIEIIAVDNNSTDGTLSVLHDYEARHPGLITVLQEPKQGAPAARNLGLKHAKGEWIQFLDADDLLLPEKLERQVESTPSCGGNIGVIFGAYIYYSSSEKQKVIQPDTRPWIALSSGLAGITSSNLFKRRFLISAGRWDEKYKSSQEYDLMFRIMKCGGEAFSIEKVLTIVRRRSNSISTTNIHHNRLRSAQLHFEICEYITRNRLVKGELYKYRVKEDMLKCMIYLYMKDKENKSRL